jgi:hypothetical protein
LIRSSIKRRLQVILRRRRELSILIAEEKVIICKIAEAIKRNAPNNKYI